MVGVHDDRDAGLEQRPGRGVTAVDEQNHAAHRRGEDERHGEDERADGDRHPVTASLVAFSTCTAMIFVPWAT